MVAIFGGFGGRRDDDREGGVLGLLVGIIVAPLAAMLIQLAISRKREFLADASGALLTRYSEGLASALEKISADPTPMRSAKSVSLNLAKRKAEREQTQIVMGSTGLTGLKRVLLGSTAAKVVALPDDDTAPVLALILFAAAPAAADAAPGMTGGEAIAYVPASLGIESGVGVGFGAGVGGGPHPLNAHFAGHVGHCGFAGRRRCRAFPPWDGAAVAFPATRRTCPLRPGSLQGSTFAQQPTWSKSPLDRGAVPDQDPACARIVAADRTPIPGLRGDRQGEAAP